MKIKVSFCIGLIACINISCKREIDTKDISIPIVGSISSVEYGIPYRYNNFDGDIWNTTWAYDDNLYFYGNDAMEIGGHAISHHMIVFGKLTGNDPQDLKGEVVNAFDDYNSNDFNNRNWKSAGLISIDGTLYMTVMKHGNYTDMYGKRYQVKDASIIKSQDYGKSWHRSYTSNRDNPMFPDKRFSSPWFIQYGKDYTDTDVENLASEYVYAISTDGQYDSGNYWYLGRVLKSKIKDLNADDWEFYKGDKSVSSGLDSLNWSRYISSAKPIITDEGNVCKTGVQYIKGIKKYVLFQWYYKPPYDIAGDPNAASTSYWYLWQSDTPWGPWEKNDKPQIWTSEGLYCPVICPKFISSDGLKATIFATGNWIQANHWQLRNDEDNAYTLWTVPITFSNNDILTNNVGTFRDGDVFSIKNAFTNTILAPENKNDGALVKLIDKTDSGRWRIEYYINGDRYYKISNIQTGLCLQINGELLTQGEFIGADHQLFLIQFIGNGKYWIYPKSNSGKLIGCKDERINKINSIVLSNHRFNKRILQRWFIEE